MIRIPILVAAAVVIAGACDRHDAPPPVTVRDSAGVRIVDVAADAAGREWRISETATVELQPPPAGAPPAHQVVSAFRMRDGRIVVASAGTGELHVHHPDGRHQRTLGGRGDGPGEFGLLFWAGPWRGDSIAAWDARAARLTVFDPAGTYARTVTPAVPLGLYPAVHGTLDDGSLVVSAGMEPGRGAPMQPGVRRDTATLVILGPDGPVRDTLGRFPATERYVMMPPGGGIGVHPLPFGRTLSVAAQETQVAVGTGDAFEAAVYEPGGGRRGVMRTGHARRRVSEDDVRRYGERMRTMGGDAGMRRQQQAFLREVPFPDRMPAVTALLPGRDGSWWAETPGPDGGSDWIRLASDGRPLDTLRVPAGVTVHEIGPDWVLVVARDADDVEHVRVHAREPSAANR